MRKFKLIKKYPNSPTLLTEVVEASPLPFYKYCDVSGGLYVSTEIENYPEYWEEVKETTLPASNIAYKCESHQEQIEIIDMLIKKGVPVFETTARVYKTHYMDNNIDCYITWVDDMICRIGAITSQLSRSEFLSAFGIIEEPKREPLFYLKDEHGDDVPIYEGDRYFYVCCNGTIDFGLYAHKEHPLQSTDITQYSTCFATEAAALKWLEEYKRTRRKPERKEDAEYFSVKGNADIAMWTDELESVFDGKRHELGNYFATEKQAEYARDHYPISKYNQFWQDLESGKITL